MKPQTIFLSLVLLLTLMSLVIPILPPIPFDYETLNLPAHFTDNNPVASDVMQFDNSPLNNPVTNDGGTLGRVLFYDKSLSQNNAIACGSCHQQQFSFSDTAIHSTGFNGGHTRRHSMTLVNARWHLDGRMFWDTRANSIEDQVLMPFQDSIEMGLTLPQLIQRVEQQSYYSQLFINAFGDSIVTPARISSAIAQFIRSIVSHSSKYDIGRAMVNGPADPFPNFTAPENEGKRIFFSDLQNGGGDCSLCHISEAFIVGPHRALNNGLDAVSTIDSGAYEATHVSTDIGKFKVPSLRNIELTAPYMHDGRFLTLEDVVEHYSTGIKLHMNLPPGLTDTTGGTPHPVQMNFNSFQKADIVKFLKTLTDTIVTTDVKWSDPFAIQATVFNNENLKLSFSIFPNPSAEFIFINADGILLDRIASIEIISVNGQVVYLQKTFLSSSTQIPVSGLEDGIYFIRVVVDGRSVTGKFVKK